MPKHDYPLQHEDARPLYLEIPQDEYDRINSRIAELERMDTEHTLQIAKMNGYISHLEEAQDESKSKTAVRWHVVATEGNPPKWGRYITIRKYPYGMAVEEHSYGKKWSSRVDVVAWISKQEMLEAGIDALNIWTIKGNT